VQIQHKADLVSVYKHLSQVHVKQGDIVQPGDAIGVVGNTGELTSGPHLHFELWHKGVAINPEEYIVF
jgi:lipoprotein NlpD